MLEFLPMLVAACVVSYGTTIFLFLPCLFLLSLTRQMTGFKVCLLGSVLGAVIFVSLTLIAWGAVVPTWPPDWELLCILAPLGCRSDYGAVSARLVG